MQDKQCMKCVKGITEYHTGDCPLATEEDRRKESNAQAQVDYQQDHKAVPAENR